MIRGDLQAVVNQAAAQEPAARYASVQDMRHDLEHYLNHQPLSVRKASFGYIVSKYYKRNLIKIKIGTAFLAILLVLGIQHHRRVSVERNIARENARAASFEAERAESVTAYLKNLIGMANPYINEDQDITLHQMLSAGYQDLLQSKGMQPHTRADILLTLGEVFRERGNYQKSQQAIQKAYRIRQTFYAPLEPAMTGIYTQLSKT